MPKTYEPAPDSVKELAESLIAKYYKDLEKSGVMLDFVFARNDMGPAVTCQGYDAAAVIRIMPLKDRAMGRKDAEITIDADIYTHLDHKGRAALLDHELYHLIVARDETNSYRFDDLHRPMLKLRKHDHQMGWFVEIAQRHGADSFEVRQASTVFFANEQVYFPFAEPVEH